MQSKLNTARIHKESQRREKTICATRKVSKNNIQVEKESYTCTHSKWENQISRVIALL